MTNSDKSYCRELVQLLCAYGVTDVILSPGSRNAPLIMAVCRQPGLRHRIVIDERSAAFVALGLSAQSQRPVAVICTSGSAMLNLAPAIAEAFYRDIPLIAVTADRPAEWIDQNDSQTIRQPGALDNIVRAHFDVPVENGTSQQAWMVNRELNDILQTATGVHPGPVHINVQLDTPLSDETEVSDDKKPRVIGVVERPTLLSTAEARALGRRLAPPQKVLIVAGGMAPDQKISRAVTRLASISNVAVLYEEQANIKGRGALTHIDCMLCSMTKLEKSAMLPDVVITMGGAPVSAHLKKWLRNADNFTHWHIGQCGHAVDLFRRLELRIELPPASFLPQLASALQPYSAQGGGYAKAWQMLSLRAYGHLQKYAAAAPWSDFSAVRMLTEALPQGTNLQVSNGTAIRLAQIFTSKKAHRFDCNRGVSGIDGSTSTAIGAAIAYNGLTVLLTGDMSAQYDMGALGCTFIPPTLRIAVLNNGGGGIFRCIKTTSRLPELDECFAAQVRLPLEQFARGFGFKYLKATDEQSMLNALKTFTEPYHNPIILDIRTDGNISAEVFKNFFKSANPNNSKTL